MLELRHVYTRYGVVECLKGISLTVNQGEIVALLGANGAGKTTVLKTISGLLRPVAGEVLFKGKNISNSSPESIVRSGVSHAPEGRKIFQKLDVLENLELGAFTRRDRDEVRKDRENVFMLFPALRQRLKQNAGTLSGGEQQMLAIGRALMTNPRLLILDEATEGLAPRVRVEIWRCLDRLKKSGLSLIVIDKNIGPLMRLADRHFILEKGRVVWSGDSDALRRDSGLLHEYVGV